MDYVGVYVHASDEPYYRANPHHQEVIDIDRYLLLLYHYGRTIKLSIRTFSSLLFRAGRTDPLAVRWPPAVTPPVLRILIGFIGQKEDKSTFTSLSFHS